MTQFLQRFINKRIIFILFIMVLFAIYLHLLQGGSDGDQSVIYEQEALKTKVGCNVVKASCPSYGKGISVFLKLDGNPSGLKVFPVEVQIDGMAKRKHSEGVSWF